MKMFAIGMIIGLILSIIAFGIVSPIVVNKLLDSKTVGTINRVTDTDGITYMSAEFTEKGMKQMDFEKKVVFKVSPVTPIAEKSCPFTDTHENHK